MEYITVVDARMGRGKSTAAIRYMNESRGRKRFLYITPFLKEVDRVCELCDFEQPDDDETTKSASLREHIRNNENVAATHSLFYLLDDTTLGLLRERHYSLIIDESIDLVSKIPILADDFTVLTDQLTTCGKDGKVSFINENYEGFASGWKKIADAGWLYRIGNTLVKFPTPEIFYAFDEVYMLTYMFDGQYLKPFLNYHGLPYKIAGVERDADGYYLSPYPDNPPPFDFGSMINIVTKDKMNDVGRAKTALSKNWFVHHSYDSEEMRWLRNGMLNFFRNITGSDKNNRLWTTFKEGQNKLINRNNGRFRNNFLQINARATNDYRDISNVAYLANRFADPTLTILFNQRGCSIDEDKYALSLMLQWIWRSSIRDYKPINVYVPSKRMRNLLTGWIEAEAGRGGCIG